MKTNSEQDLNEDVMEKKDLEAQKIIQDITNFIENNFMTLLEKSLLIQGQPSTLQLISFSIKKLVSNFLQNTSSSLFHKSFFIDRY